MKNNKKKSTQMVNTKTLLYCSLALNILFILTSLLFVFIINNSGTNRFNQSVLRSIITYTEEQFCQGAGYEKITSEIKAGTATEDVDTAIKMFNESVCGVGENSQF